MNPAVPPHCYHLGGEKQVRKPGMHPCSLNTLKAEDARTGILSGNVYSIISHAHDTEITLSVTINHNRQQIFIE